MVEIPQGHEPAAARSSGPVPRHDDDDSDLESTRFEPDLIRSRAGRRSLRDKLSASLNGWKHAIRGDSSFFAHAYRAFLVGLIAALLGVGPQGWIALVLAGCLIFIAELNNSAVDTLARAIGDPDESRLKVAREIAAGGVLVAVVGAATVATVILVLKFGDLLNWWR